MKISLITVCYNAEKTIEDTLNSVLCQTYSEYEYWIIDGASQDKTLAIVESYQKKFQGKMHVISEKDNGIYDAMNKGIRHATGDIIGILNADDVLANSDVFATIANIFKELDIDGTYSDLLMLNETLEKPVRVFKANNVSNRFGWHPPHPTLYVKKEVYEKIGMFDLQYRIAADYDFMLRLLKIKPKLHYIKSYLVYMRSGGTSTDGIKGYIRNWKEANKVLKNNHVTFPYFCNVIRTFKTIGQGIRAKWKKGF